MTFGLEPGTCRGCIKHLPLYPSTLQLTYYLCLPQPSDSRSKHSSSTLTQNVIPRIRTPPLLPSRNPSFPLRPPRNILRRPLLLPLPPLPLNDNANLQNLRPALPPRSPPHPNRLGITPRVRASLHRYLALGFRVSFCVVFDRTSCALGIRNGGLDYSRGNV